ncbi:hypothetical protein TOPH_03310 [Tolypocladium ophioglossoides CBS 100239]|uniref:BTB domain-containing protein n=1 Tax=Tolypocladium ophioglossoides (strain CBS 100239) TaxID=1163406 RepID=A0A0L0NDF3_TOLOC|nr:hypothetical protein TOPH_03310 [Tolypocladium ophioglossoides CBS 100239]
MEVESIINESTESCRETSEAVLLDPDGDVILVINAVARSASKSFVVSSKALGLASPVLSKMLSPGFKEGMQFRSEKRPRISLEEDDPTAMELILRILHCQSADISFSMDPKTLAILAIHCDKYDCNGALRPWILHWCGNYQGVSAPEDWGFMLLAAYMFRSPKFSDIAATSAKRLVPSFAVVWDEHEILALLPETLAEALADQITEALEILQSNLQSADERLRGQRSAFTMSGLACMNCGRIHPETAKKCHSCKNTDLLNRHCTEDYRVAEYFTVLRRFRLWPSVIPFTICALSEIVFRLQCAQSDHKHQCSAREACPLRRELELLFVQAQRVLGNMKGISL